jgi:hypothetical protein
MFAATEVLDHEHLCLSQSSVPCCEVLKRWSTVPLDVRCRIKGLFCASEAILCDRVGVYVCFVKLERGRGKLF